MLIKRHTKRVPVWFHLYEVKKKENVLFGGRSKRSSYLLEVSDWKGIGGISGVTVI